MPSEIINALASLKCEYIKIRSGVVNQTLYDNLVCHLPGLLGLKLMQCDVSSIVNWDDFFSAFKCLEHLSLMEIQHTGIINAICNMNNGL